MPSASVSLSVGFEPYVFTSVPSDSVSPSESAEPVPFGRVVIRAVRFIEPANANQCKVSAPLVPEISRRSVALAFVRPSTRRLRSAVDPSVAYHARNRGAAVKFFGKATVAGFAAAPTATDPRVQVARADASDWGAIATYPTVSAGCASPAFTRILASKPANVGERTRAAATSGSAYDWICAITIGGPPNHSRKGNVEKVVPALTLPASTTVPSGRTWFPDSSTR